MRHENGPWHEGFIKDMNRIEESCIDMLEAHFHIKREVMRHHELRQIRQSCRMVSWNFVPPIHRESSLNSTFDLRAISRLIAPVPYLLG